MRERYLKMRREGLYNDMVWFYEYYINEFPNIPPTWITPNSEVREREIIPSQIFFQVFSMTFSIYSGSILEYLDKKLEVLKIEDTNNNILYIN